MIASMQCLFRTFLCCALLPAPLVAHSAGESTPGKPAAAKAPVKKKAAVKAPPAPPAAGAEQLEAAQGVYYGAYECEFKLALGVAASTKFPGYVDVTFGKAVYLMKPVLSTTGAIRLEHTMGETVLVQIATKSMLLNVKSGQRMVDECIGAKQREAIEVARRAAAEAAATAAQQQAQPASEAAPAAASAPPPAAASSPSQPR